MNALRKIKKKIRKRGEQAQLTEIYNRYKDYTRIPKHSYLANLSVMLDYASDGCVVECGVWRGGMMAGLAELRPELHYYLFDSFEGLPEANEIDGQSAVNWMNDNDVKCCATEESFAREIMAKAGALSYSIEKGWFESTLKNYSFSSGISVLRLDADWYSSTAECLNFLYEDVKVGGVVILDDYFAWDGCSKAVHDFLSLNKLPDRIQTVGEKLAYFVKKEERITTALNPNP